MLTAKIQQLLQFIQREPVLSVSIMLALLSMLWVKPDEAYATYIDFRTLGILLCLMLVVAGLQKLGIFDMLAEKVLQKAKTTTDIVVLLVALCFFSSMLITNDVALITFVPFTIVIMHKMPKPVRDYWLLKAVAMQTIAANLGSMLTPVGNPQNLYLYSKAGVSISSMLRLMLPYSAAALVLLFIWIGFAAGKAPKSDLSESLPSSYASCLKIKAADKPYFFAYILLFSFSLLCVSRVLSFQALLLVVLVYVLVCDPQVLKKADYSLLATFAALFIFIGNLARVPEFSVLLKHLLIGHETITAVIASQFMSNVPAAILLSEFTGNYKALLIGTNLGGLGTMIASMASLISFKYITHENSTLCGKYIGVFTASNLLFLTALLLLSHVLSM